MLQKFWNQARTAALPNYLMWMIASVKVLVPSTLLIAAGEWHRLVRAAIEQVSPKLDLGRILRFSLAAVIAITVPVLPVIAHTAHVRAQTSTAQNSVLGITGFWQSTLHPGIDLRIVIDISMVGNGRYKELIYGIDPSGATVSSDSISFQNGVVRWTITSGGSFEGELSADEKRIEGKWTDLGPVQFPVTLVRISSQVARKMISELSNPVLLPVNLTFDVASIRRSHKSTEGMSIQPKTDGISIRNGTLWEILFDAYNVPGITRIVVDDQLSGLPSWAHSDRFDVEAKIGDENLAAWQKLPLREQWQQRQLMLQALLADRFQLKIRHELKNRPIYALIIAKSGCKLKVSQSNNSRETVGDGQFNFTASQIDNFALSLSSEVGRIVVDKTGLTGRYDIALHWTRDELQGEAALGLRSILRFRSSLG